MVINCLDYVNYCYSHEDGETILTIIRSSLESGDDVIISFKGINCVTSSFVNAALVPLLEDYAYNEIREKVHFIDSIKQINQMIKQRFDFEVCHRKDLVLF